MAKQSINLSKEALAALRLPVHTKELPWDDGFDIVDAGGSRVATVCGWETNHSQDREIAAALAQLINAAFTPAAEPAPEVCRMGDCMMDAAPASLYCAEHRVAVQRELS